MTKFSQKTSVFILSIVEMLEKFSYYGLRAILVLYAVDQTGLNVERELALSFYGATSAIALFIILPIGILTDLVLKQKNAVLLGGFLTLLGISTLVSKNINIVGVGMILSIIGTGMVKLNIPILLGRLFQKEDRKRNAAFLFQHFFINFGSFLGVLICGYVGERIGYSHAFCLIAGATTAYLLIFFFSKNRLDCNEINSRISDPRDNQILDSFEKIRSLKVFPILLFFAIFVVVFTRTWQISLEPLYEISEFGKTYNLFGFEIGASILRGLESFISIPMMLLIALLWWNRGSGNTFKQLSFASILMSIGIVGMYFLPLVPEKNIAGFLLVPLTFLSIGNVIASALEYSYVTRLSDIRFSSTILGGYEVLRYGMLSGLGYLLAFTDLENQLLLWSAIAISLAAIAYFSKDIFSKLAGGID